MFKIKQASPKSKEELLKEMTEKRPLPVGMAEFEVWSERIISGACLPATKESLQFVLSDMILHLAPSEAFKEDGYFINSLRKFACNEVAVAKRKQLYEDKQARQAAEALEQAKLKQSEVTPTSGGAGEVLEATKV
jgi:hypothetical protein